MKRICGKIKKKGLDFRRSVYNIKLKLSFPLRDSERKVILVILDMIAVSLALFLSLGLRPDYELSFNLLAKYPHWFIFFNLIWFLAAHVFDLYDLSVASSMLSSSMKILKTGLITCLIFLLIPYLTPILPPGRRYILALFIFVIGFVSCLRLLYTRLISEPFMKRRALIIGTGWEASFIAKAINEYGRNAYEVLGAVRIVSPKTNLSSNLINQGENISSKDLKDQIRSLNDCEPVQEEKAISSEIKNQPLKKNRNTDNKENENFLPIIGEMANIKWLIKKYDIRTLILACPGQMNGLLLDMITSCLELGVEIVPMATLYERFTGRVPVEHIGDQWYVAMPINHPGTGTLWPLLKRTADIILASLGLFFLAIIMPFVALAIYIDSPGPIFYLQERIGKGGRIFKAIKLRTMMVGADKNGPAWTLPNDSRVTRVGKILRRTHIDEFPQLINILKGEMSVVGPRALNLKEYEQIKDIPFYNIRHCIRPGMAGWGLIKQGYGSSREDAIVRLQYDLYYIKHQGPWLDTIIFLKTVLDTIAFRGRA